MSDVLNPEINNFTAQNKNLFVIGVPDDGFEFYMGDWNNGEVSLGYRRNSYLDSKDPTHKDHVFLTSETLLRASYFKIIGKLSELTDEQAKEYVETENEGKYFDYYEVEDRRISAVESFKSLLRKKGIGYNIGLGKDYIIIEKTS